MIKNNKQYSQCEEHILNPSYAVVGYNDLSKKQSGDMEHHNYL